MIRQDPSETLRTTVRPSRPPRFTLIPAPLVPAHPHLSHPHTLSDSQATSPGPYPHAFPSQASEVWGPRPLGQGCQGPLRTELAGTQEWCSSPSESRLLHLFSERPKTSFGPRSGVWSDLEPGWGEAWGPQGRRPGQSR